MTLARVPDAADYQAIRIVAPVVWWRERTFAPRNSPLTRGRVQPFRYFELLLARRTPAVPANEAVRRKNYNEYHGPQVYYARSST